MKKYVFGILTGVGIMLLAVACNDANGGVDDNGFDRRTLLKNTAENLIKPAFSDLKTQVNALKSGTDAFVNAPTAANLAALKAQWTEAFSAWQFANGFNFGPAGESGVRKGLVEEIGTFPVNTAQTEAFIAANDTGFQNFARDTRGFLAVEYVIFGESALSKLQNQVNRRLYLTALVNHLKARVDFVANAWAADNYAATFAADNATSVGSAIAVYYNEFVKNYEAFKNFKIALPLGKRAGQTQIEPQKVEAFYSGLSLDALKWHFQACENVWYGKNRQGLDGVGFREYLQAVEGGKALIDATELQIAAVRAALAAVPTNKTLSQLIQENHPSVLALQVETQKMVRYFKSDLSSLLGIAITYASGDGD